MSGKQAVLIGVALILALYFGGEAAYRQVTAPWSIGQVGRDTLTGPWTGSLRARQGAEYGLWLDLEYRPPSVRGSRRRARGGSTRPNLEGSATLCTPKGERYDYEVSGEANRDGVVNVLRLEYGNPSLSALDLQLTGAWRDRALSISANKNPFLPDGTFVAVRSISSDDPDDSFAPVTLTQRDRAAFEATCQRIRA
jgi:hypothetical protein